MQTIAFGMGKQWDTAVYGIIGQQGPAIYHRELYTTLCDDLYGKRIRKRMGMCICVAESLWCTAEIITTL